MIDPWVKAVVERYKGRDDPFLMSLLRSYIPNKTAMDIISVQPMLKSAGEIFTLRIPKPIIDITEFMFYGDVDEDLLNIWSEL